MNAFLYSQDTTPIPEFSRISSFDSPVTVTEQAFPGGGRLMMWGELSGDVNLSRNGDRSFLLLFGHISEVYQGPAMTNPPRAASFLRECLEGDASGSAVQRLLNRLHGSFSILFRDFSQGLFLCMTDRMASRPIWKVRAKEGWMISSHATAIACTTGAAIDPGGLGALLLYGGPVAPGQSLYGGIEAVLPGRILDLTEAAAPTESTWFQFRHQPDESLALAEWVEIAAQRLVRSASRIVAECARPVVFFSGGVDSRLTAAALKAAGGNPLLVTLGETRNLEVQISERAARAMALQHIVILRDKHWYFGRCLGSSRRPREFLSGLTAISQTPFALLARNFGVECFYWEIFAKRSARCSAGWSGAPCGLGRQQNS